MFWENVSIFKSNLCHRNEVTEKRKVRLAKLIFYILSTNVVVFDKAAWESPARTNLFQKVKKDFFFSLPSGTREYHYLSPITYSHIIYCRVIPLNKVKSPRVSLQHVFPATDASHTSMTPPIHDWRFIWVRVIFWIKKVIYCFNFNFLFLFFLLVTMGHHTKLESSYLRKRCDMVRAYVNNQENNWKLIMISLYYS